jgi:hypothetical protein
MPSQGTAGRLISGVLVTIPHVPVSTGAGKNREKHGSAETLARKNLIWLIILAVAVFSQGDRSGTAEYQVAKVERRDLAAQVYGSTVAAKAAVASSARSRQTVDYADQGDHANVDNCSPGGKKATISLFSAPVGGRGEQGAANLNGQAGLEKACANLVWRRRMPGV